MDWRNERIGEMKGLEKWKDQRYKRIREMKGLNN